MMLFGIDQLAEDAARDVAQLVDLDDLAEAFGHLRAHDRPGRADGAAEEFRASCRSRAPRPPRSTTSRRTSRCRTARRPCRRRRPRCDAARSWPRRCDRSVCIRNAFEGLPWCVTSPYPPPCSCSPPARLPHRHRRHRRRRPAPRIVQAKDLPPLGPCAASSWRPERHRRRRASRHRWCCCRCRNGARFGKQVITYPGRWRRAADRACRASARHEAPERVRDYWRAVDQPGRSGMDDVAWSAAFISWVMESAGVPRDLFCPDQRHTIYVERVVERASGRAPSFLPTSPRVTPPRSVTLYVRRGRTAARPWTTSIAAPAIATSWSRSGRARYTR